MADLHELIERVQVMLASSMDPSKEELSALHGELDTEIRLANKRLRECDALLTNGHRSEAIQLAEQEPNLLDIVSVLDFPELLEWNDFVAELGLKVTPELQMDIAADLNGAYSEDEPIEQHLRRFRIYSLARAPLKKRLSLIRIIAELDAINPVWETDVQEYEKTRLRQIKDEVREASRDQSYDTLNDLSDELHDSRWIIKPPKQLVAQVDKAVHQMGSAQSTEKLKKVAEELQQAQAADDLEWCVSATAKWQQIAQDCDPNSAEFQEVQSLAMPALRWVARSQKEQAQADQFNDKVKRLERAISSSTDTVDLKKRYGEVARESNGPMPEYIKDMYQEKLNELKKKQTVKKLAIIGGVVAAVILIGTLIHLFTSETKRDIQAGSLKVLLDQNNLTDAKALIEKVRTEDANALASTAFQEQMTRYESLVQSSNSKQAEFERGRRRIQAIIAVSNNATEFDEAANILATLRNSPLAGENRNVLDELEDNVRIARGKFSKDIQKQFSAIYNDINARAMPALREKSEDTDDLDKLNRELASLNNMSGLTAENRADISRLIRNIESEVTRRKTSKKKSAVKGVASSIGTEEAFEKSVRENAERYLIPSDLDAIFAADRKFAEALEDWSAFNQKLLELPTAELLASADSLTETYDSQRKTIPVPAQFDEFFEAVRSSKSREVGGNLKQFRRMLEYKFVANVNMIQERSGIRNYFDGEPVLSKGYYQIDAFSTHDPPKAHPKQLRSTLVIDNSAEKWLSPQSRFSRVALQILNQRKPGEWEEPFAEILTEFFSDDYDQFDPILRLKLLKQCLKTANDGSRFLDQAYADYHGAIERANIDVSGNWCDDQGQNSPESSLAIALLSRLKRTKVDTQKIVEARDTFFARRPSFVYKWVGWCVTKQSKLTVEFGDFDIAPQIDLYALSKESTTSPVEFQRIGRVYNGNVSLNISGQFCQAGQRVYVQSKLQ